MLVGFHFAADTITKPSPHSEPLRSCSRTESTHSTGSSRFIPARPVRISKSDCLFIRSSGMPITLVIADDHPLLLDGLSALLACEKDFQVLARCATGDEALEALRRHHPDVLVLDVHMAGKNGLQVVRELVSARIGTRCVILTAGLNAEQTVEAMRLGVAGVVLKEMAPKLLVQCIRKVSVGEKWLERRSFGDAMMTMINNHEMARRVTDVLTRRELQVLKMVASGMRNREIGKRLFISEGTVK